MVKLILDEEDLNKPTSNVGKAVHDILSTDQSETEVGDIISNYAPSYVKEMETAVENGLRKYKPPFYVVVLHKKEMWAMNVMRNWFVTRQTKPLASSMWQEFPNHMHTVYEYDGTDLKLLWSLPSPQEGKVILTNWALYDPQLVTWVKEAFAGTLN